MKEVLATVIENKPIAENIRSMTLSLPEKIPMRCGQFINLSTGNRMQLLKRPLGIAKHTENSVTVCYQIKGEGTKSLSEIKVGAELSVLLPLGNGFTIAESEHRIALVGGGVGIFPLLSVLQEYRGKKEFYSYLGFRNERAVCLTEEFSDSTRLVLSTDDGSAGRKGNAVEAFLAEYDAETPDVILACGPPIMLRVLKEELQRRNIATKCFVSLEERMGCGIGACLVCVCDLTNGAHARVCKDGPVFEVTEVEL